MKVAKALNRRWKISMVENLASSIQGHITELIKRLKVVLVTFIVTLLVALVLPANTDFFATTSNYAPLMSAFLNYISHTFLPPNIKLFAVSVSDPITLYVLAAVVFAVAATMPVLAYEVYKFIDPALEAKERKLIFPFVSAVTLLFIAGAAFGFFFLFSTFIEGLFPFFYAVGAEPWFSIMDFYSMLFFTIIISGILFTLPVFFVILTKFGILRPSMFTKKRKFIYLGMIALAMFISPGATPQGNLYLSIILIAIFEISMLLGKKFSPKPERSGETTVIEQLHDPTCEYCGNRISKNAKYCPSCKRYLA